MGTDSVRPVRKRDGILLFKTIRNRGVISKVLIVSIATMFFFLGFSFLGPNLNVYLTRQFGYSKTSIGVVSFVGIGIATILQSSSGYFSDKYGRKPVMLVGGLAFILGNLILLWGGEVQWVFLCYVLINYYNSFNMVASAYISGVVDPQERSGALGILSSLGSFARSTASVAGGWL